MKSSDQASGFFSHLIELRTRLLRSLFVIGAIFCVLVFFRSTIYAYLATPLLTVLPEGAGMIATDVASPFLIPLKFALFVAVVLSVPYLLYQLWAFVTPGLYEHERHLIMPLLLSSVALFYIGMAFAYFIVFPLIFAFFAGTVPAGVTMMTDISAYLSFVLALFLAFGLVFEIPVAVVILVWMDVVSPKTLAAKRPYIIIGAFLFGMILTPPDVFSQTLLALPMIILFEAGLFFARRLSVRTKKGGHPARDAE